jgi:hypothetical protein
MLSAPASISDVGENIAVKPLKLVSIAVVAGLLACGSVASAGAAVSSATATVPPPGGYVTTAKVALLYGFSKVIRKVNVAKVTNPSTGVYCILPAVQLNLLRIFPQVTVERSLSVGYAFWAYWVDTTNFTLNCPDGYLEVITEEWNGGSPAPSNSVGFSLFIQ